MTMKILAVFLGGAFGSVSRYAVYLLAEQKGILQKFWATLSVNILGSFFIGIIWALLTEQKSTVHWQLLLISGFLGGFTTFSAFSLDVLNLYRQGEIKIALLYIAVSLIGSLIMIFSAYYMVKWVKG